jgi:hypothetical protein
MSNHSYLRTTCATFVATLCLATPLVAQTDANAAPIALTINDVVPATGFSTDAVTDVLGLRIGMTATEFDAALADTGLPLFADAKPIPDAPAYGPLRMGYAAQNGDVTPQFQWADGYKMSFVPVRATAGLTMYSEMVDAAGVSKPLLNG